jgi:hypothetical protein
VASLPEEPSPRIYTSLGPAIGATRSLPRTIGGARVGLTGLPVPSANFTRAAFLPCWNEAIAAQQVAGLVQTCATRAQPTSITCALSAYGGSQNRPNTKFAAAVIESLMTKQVPDFDISKGTSSSLLDIAIGTAPRIDKAGPAPDPAPPEREPALANALFPSSQWHSEDKSKTPPAARSATRNEHSVRKPNATSMASHTQPGGSFIGASKFRNQQ